MAHLMRQRHWQRHQEEHPFPPSPPRRAAAARANNGGRKGGAPLLLRLRDGEKGGSQQQRAAAPSPVALLVDDQCALSRFWSDWRAAEHRFLTGAGAAAAAGHGCIGGGERWLAGWFCVRCWSDRNRACVCVCVSPLIESI